MLLTTVNPIQYVGKAETFGIAHGDIKRRLTQLASQPYVVASLHETLRRVREK